MNISKFIDKTETFEAEYNGEKVSFKARTASLTPGFMKDVDNLKGYSKAVADVVTEWDVTADGEAWPLTVEELDRLPADFLVTILNTISASWAGDKKKSTDSPNSSAASS